MIRAGLHAGFSLAELAGIFRERAAGGAPCRRVANLASEKVRSLDRQIAQLTQLRDWLSQTVAAWQQRQICNFGGQQDLRRGCVAHQYVVNRP